MIPPLLLLMGSGLLAATALLVPSLSDLLLLALPCALASGLLLLRAWRAGEGRKQIVVDGSNVMYWKDGAPDIRAVRDVVDHLRVQGYHPRVIFDANAGYLLIGRYQHDRALSSQLDLPVAQVTVVPKGTPADPLILQTARATRGQVVSRDQFRDWAEAHPEVTRPGHLIKGGYRKGHLWLSLPQEAAPRA